LNTLLVSIPDEIDIPGTDLYLEGGVSKNFTIIENQYMTIPLDISLQNKSRVTNRTNDVNFHVHEFEGY
jgi:hypothetical protein